MKSRRTLQSPLLLLGLGLGFSQGLSAETTSFPALLALLDVERQTVLVPDDPVELDLSCVSDFERAKGGYQFTDATARSFTVPEGAEIGDIYFTRLPIFNLNDPAEDNAMFRWANRFHTLTQEDTIRRVLVIDSDEEYERRLLEESARLLRGEGYFYDADVRPVRVCGDTVDIEVITRDNWALAPSISYDRVGGENRFAMGLSHSNLLGMGKQLEVSYEDGLDTTSSRITYQDNNVFGTRMRNLTSYSDTDEGSSFQFGFDLPFYSLESQRAWAFRVLQEERQDEQYFRGEEVSEVAHDVEDYALEWGTSAGLVNGFAKRWLVGYRYRSDEYGRTAVLPPPANFPQDRELSYPYLKFESVEDGYVTTYNLNQIHRTEDLQIGRSWSLSLGYAAEAFGSDADHLVLEGSFQDTLRYNRKMLWQHSLSLESLFNQDINETEDFLLSYENRYFRRQTSHNSFLVNFRATYSDNLTSHRQILMGGNEGARGFENEFQVGDRSVLLSVEERVYTDIHLFNLIRLGGSVFADAGRAWEPGVESGFEDDWLANVGFGLRLASSKAASSRIAHLDFAFPVTNTSDPQVKNMLISFTVKSHF